MLPSAATIEGWRCVSLPPALACSSAAPSLLLLLGLRLLPPLLPACMPPSDSRGTDAGLSHRRAAGCSLLLIEHRLAAAAAGATVTPATTTGAAAPAAAAEPGLPPAAVAAAAASSAGIQLGRRTPQNSPCCCTLAELLRGVAPATAFAPAAAAAAAVAAAAAAGCSPATAATSSLLCSVSLNAFCVAMSASASASALASALRLTSKASHLRRPSPPCRCSCVHEHMRSQMQQRGSSRHGAGGSVRRCVAQRQGHACRHACMHGCCHACVVGAGMHVFLCVLSAAATHMCDVAEHLVALELPDHDAKRKCHACRGFWRQQQQQQRRWAVGRGNSIRAAVTAAR